MWWKTSVGCRPFLATGPSRTWCCSRSPSSAARKRYPLMTAPGHDLPSGQDSSSGHEVPPTCYRHPDRETWVSCVRCGRHACPDCLREAAVGQQCVECVRGANAGGRAPRTVFGGRPAAGAVVTWTLVGLNVLLFLVELAKP